ncbi:MAG: M6 family metalloprotease domain-containing protein [Candidatus Brocadiaceae bacterium]|nr:M6 family metalloprotease domain-containing protein [Candidatus Brocadiaceae bacterium]
MEQKKGNKSTLCCVQKSFLKRGQEGILTLFTSLLLSALIFPLKLYAIPAYEGLFTLQQSSGFTFEARQHGDEWYNWVETKDGYGIYKNSTSGNWEYYIPSADYDRGKRPSSLIGRTSHAVVGIADPSLLGIPRGLRPPKTSLKKPESSGSNRNVFPKKNLQTEAALEKGSKGTAIRGTIHLLIIAVDYEDMKATYPANQIQPLLFGDSNSVSDYYSKTSYSSVSIAPAAELHGTLNDGFIGWLRLSGNHPNTGSNTDERNQAISKSAILAADPYIDYAQYDTNEDGVIEPTELSIMVMVAGYEAAANSPSPSVWAHSWGISGGCQVDNKTIYAYAQFGEKHRNHLATFGVMAHELGHQMFGLPDLYDTDYSNGFSYGIGYFDLMGYGSWGRSASGFDAGSSPTYLSAWCKEYLSWGNVNTISSSQCVSFPKADGNSSSIFRLNTADTNQYFLIENRQFSGYDAGFQSVTGATGHGGIVIYHIDRAKTPPLNWQVNADQNDKGVDVEEANEGCLENLCSKLDAAVSLVETNMFFFCGNNSDFTDTTIPGSRLKNGDPTNISVTGISSYGDIMTAMVVPSIFCTYSLSTIGQTFDSSGGTGSVDIATLSDICAWTTSSNEDWITIISGDSGTGSGTVYYSVSPNKDTSARSGIMTLAGQTFTVTQYGVECTYSLSSTSQTFDFSGGSGSVGVTASSEICVWMATSNEDWITITSGDSGTGSGTVYYSVSPNKDTSARSGIMTLAGQTFTVTQYGMECTYSLSSTSQTFDFSEGSGSVGVTASSEICVWMATSNADWIIITSGSSNAGSGTVYYSVSPNKDTSARSGIMAIAGQTFTVTQYGISIPTPTPTPIPTPTPPPCIVKRLDVKPKSLRLVRETSTQKTVTLICKDGFTPANQPVRAKIMNGKKLVDVSPTVAYTDGNGQATFTIIAANKTGDAIVRFRHQKLINDVTVKVRKQ